MSRSTPPCSIEPAQAQAGHLNLQDWLMLVQNDRVTCGITLCHTMQVLPMYPYL
jgi:hypothetical protein